MGAMNSPADGVLVLYGKPGCCLCDDAKPVVMAVAARHGLTLEAASILTDAALYDQYRFRIPVVMYRGRVLDEGQISADRITAALRHVQRLPKGDEGARS